MPGKTPLSQTSLIFGHATALGANHPALLTIGLQAFLFAKICVATWVVSRNPGENPVSWMIAHLSDFVAALVQALRGRPALL